MCAWAVGNCCRPNRGTRQRVSVTVTGRLGSSLACRPLPHTHGDRSRSETRSRSSHARKRAPSLRTLTSGVGRHPARRLEARCRCGCGAREVVVGSGDSRGTSPDDIPLPGRGAELTGISRNLPSKRVVQRLTWDLRHAMVRGGLGERPLNNMCAPNRRTA